MVTICHEIGLVGHWSAITCHKCFQSFADLHQASLLGSKSDHASNLSELFHILAPIYRPISNPMIHLFMHHNRMFIGDQHKWPLTILMVSLLGHSWICKVSCMEHGCCWFLLFSPIFPIGWSPHFVNIPVFGTVICWCVECLVVVVSWHAHAMIVF